MLQHALRNVEEASLHACLLVFVGQMTRNPPGGKLLVAETLWIMPQMVPQERLNLILIEQRSHAYLLCCINILNRISKYGSHSLPCSSFIVTRSLHAPLKSTWCTAITLSPCTVISSRWISTGGTLYADKIRKTESPAPIAHTSNKLPSWKHYCVCSRHLRCWLLLLSSAECTNWTRACQLNAENLSAGVKYGALHFVLPSHKKRDNLNISH